MAEKKTKEPVKAAKAKTSSESTEKTYSLRGKEFVGVVVSDKMRKTVTVQWEWKRYISKYERYLKKSSKVAAHNPESMNAKTGDTVRIKETRPISKTKNFVVTEIIKRADK